MFKPTKKKPIKSRENVEFKLEFHATKVPQRGWDKLLVSLISLDTNKVLAKTGKVQVKNGACQWSEPIPLLCLEPIGKDTSKALYKMVVSMGLSRFGLLGEATINLADYVHAVLPVSLSLPLQNCNSGSILHVNLQRIMPKSANIDSEGKKEMFTEEGRKSHMLDAMEQNKLENDEQNGAGKVGTMNKIDLASLPSTPRLSLDSVDVPPTPEVSESRFSGREGDELLSPSSSSIGSCNGKQDSGKGFASYAGSNRTTHQGFASDCMPLREQDSPRCLPYHSKSLEESCSPIERFHSEEVLSWVLEKSDGPHLPAMKAASVNEVRLKTASWEQRGKQMDMEMETLKKQLAEETSRNEKLQRALSALGKDCDSINLGKKGHQMSWEGSDWQELQEELKYEKSMNSNLSLQLRKTQEANSELLLEIQDLERLLHGKVESKQSEQESSDKDLKKEVDTLKAELEELERDSKELTQENMDLIAQLKLANDKLKSSEATVAQLELKMKNGLHTAAEAEEEKLSRMVDELRGKLRECDESYEGKLATSRTLIDDLNSSIMMIRNKNSRLERELQSSEGHISVLLKDVESLKSENEGHLKELTTHKGQVKLWHDKASKAEQESLIALKRVEHLEAVNREVKREKSKDLQAIKKQLEDLQEQLVVTDGKHKDALQVVAKTREEKAGLEREISVVLKAKEAVEATVAQAQSLNGILQEKLRVGEMKTLELLQRLEEEEAKSSSLLQENGASENRVMELSTLREELEGRIHSLQEENMHCHCQMQELRLQIAAKQEEALSLQDSSSATNAKLKSLQMENDGLVEKLRNAQEDNEWARENTNTLVNEIRELERELDSDMMVQEHLKQSVSDLKTQKLDLQAQIEELMDKTTRLEKQVVDMEGHLMDAMNEKKALLMSMQEQKGVQKDTENSLRALIVQQEDRIKELQEFDGKSVVQQALLELNDEKAELEGKVVQLQGMLAQAKKDVGDANAKEKQAALDASILRDAKGHLEDNVLKLEEMLKEAKMEALSLTQSLDFQFREAAAKDLDITKKLDESALQVQCLQEEKLVYAQKVMGLEAQCVAVELERKRASTKMSQAKTELEGLHREKEEIDKVNSCLKEEKEKLRLCLQRNEQDVLTLKGRLKSCEEAACMWKQSKSSMEETILQLQEENRKLNEMKNQMDELKYKLLEQELGREELRARVKGLEEELQTARSADVGQKLDLKDKVAELELSKNQSKHEYVQLNSKIKGLERINEQLRKQLGTNKTDQLLIEVDSLQTQNAALCQRETELLSKLSSQEALQLELYNLKEEKQALELALSSFNAAVNAENFSKRVTSLELELAEALEANSMYKQQLQSAFSKQQNVHAAALENLGSVEQVIEDLTELKRRNGILDEELKDMRERYLRMSLQFAEVEAEREELVMTVRSLRGARKLIPHKSANF